MQNDINMGRIKLYTFLGLLSGFNLAIFGFGKEAPQMKTGGLPYIVTNHWELPYPLHEISGIAWVEKNKIAAVEDEDGSIFIYNLKKGKIAKEIPFGEPGDYEGVSVRGASAYVLRSDCIIFEIRNFMDSERAVKTYKTPFSSKNDMETLELDSDQNQLLILPKDHDLNSDRPKGIYFFSLDTKKTNLEPVFTIDMGDMALKHFRENDLQKTFRQSDMAIHPKTEEIYVIEGSKPKLLILNPDGKVKKVYELDKNAFRNPKALPLVLMGNCIFRAKEKNMVKAPLPN